MASTKKTYHHISRLLFCLVVIFMTFALKAQDKSEEIKSPLNEHEIKDLTELVKYDKTVKKLKSKNRKNKSSENSEKTQEKDETVNSNSNLSFGLGPIFTGLLYVIIAALVIFVLFIIFSSIKVDKRLKPESKVVPEEIEDIEVIDAESGLELALQADNYRGAVRMLFIKLLQILVQENSIEWKPEKTNRDYLREMNKHPKILHFNNLVIAYERIWYGSEPIDELFFNYLRGDFEKFYSTDNINVNVEE